MRSVLMSCLLGIGIAGFMGGCGAVQGTTVVKYDRGGIARVVEVTESGTYALIGFSEANKQFQYALNKGDKIGFVDEGGKLYAVAGKDRQEVQTTAVMNRTLYWKKVK